ncbi:Golgi-associated kinase 1A [Electrophorus electricus]|uniref:Golgi-associated kinase 1A n=1 Tax=Electrophorus electricus TaxID=8005 RepID=UPI0015D053AB|nr:Golgi-associated kinase 1A [Electrophorus electricus]
MSLRPGLKLRVKRRYIVAFLSLLTVSAVMINTRSPSPSEERSVPPKGPQHKQATGLKVTDSILPLHRLPPHGRSGAWKLSEMKDPAKPLPLEGRHHQHRGNKVQERVQRAIQKHLKNNVKRTFTKPKQGVYLGKNKHLPQMFKASAKGRQNNKQGNGKVLSNDIHHLLSSHVQTVLQSASMQSLQPDMRPCRHKCSPDGPKPERLLGKAGAQQPLELKHASGETNIHERKAEPAKKERHHFTSKNINIVSGAEADGRDFMTGWCETLHDKNFRENWRQTRAESLPWFSRDDVEKMDMLATGTVLSKARLPGHGQVLQVGLGSCSDCALPLGGNHSRLCETGNCALIKRTSDWFEVLAFHLDRVLGLNRSLPAVLRTFHSDLLPYKYTSGSLRPVVWWDPDIQHLADDDNDQKSFSLTWPQYQTLLKTRCGIQMPLNSSACVGVHHSEWGRLALFDFLLQVHDRLDRYCCGFHPDPADLCVENLLNVQCSNPQHLMLVHILVRRADPSRLVFIDNAGRPRHPQDDLNFRLLEGIDEFPARALQVLRSGCLEQLLLHSLSADKALWESRGGAAGLRTTIHNLQHRANALLQHIRGKSGEQE